MCEQYAATVAVASRIVSAASSSAAHLALEEVLVDYPGAAAILGYLPRVAERDVRADR